MVVTNREYLKAIKAQLDRMEKTLATLTRGQGVLSDNQRVLRDEAKAMNQAELVADIRAKKDILKAIDTAANGLEEGATSIAAKIAELKAQIEAGGTPDFTDVEAELAEMQGVIGSLSESIPANTPQA